MRVSESMQGPAAFSIKKLSLPFGGTKIDLHGMGLFIFLYCISGRALDFIYAQNGKYVILHFSVMLVNISMQ